MSGLLVLVAALLSSFGTSLSIGPPELRPVGDGFAPEIPGMSLLSSESGFLRPVKVFFIPVPPDVEPVLEYRVHSTASTGWHRVQWAMVPELSGTGLETVEVHRSAGSAPPSHAVTVKVVPLAGTRVAMVTVDPFCYGDLSRYASGVSFSLDWPGRTGGRPVQGTLLEALAPQGSLWWRERTRVPDSPFWGRPWARIRVAGTGLYAVTGSELAAAGCPVVGMPSASLAMLTGPGIPFDLEDPGDEHLPAAVSLSVSDGGDGVFDPSDTLFFYGRGLIRADVAGDSLYHTWHRYDQANTYWLTWGGAPGLRMGTAEAAYQGHPSWGPTSPHLLWMEQDYSWFAEEDRTGWCWSPIPPASPSYIYFSPPPGSSGRALRVSILHSRTVGWGSDSLVLNGVTVFDSTFINNRYVRLWTVREPPLNPGVNTLKIWSRNDQGTSVFNYLELEVESPLETGRQLFFLGRPPGLYTIEVPGVEPGARAFLTDSPFEPVELLGWEASGGTARITAEIMQTGSMWVVNPGEWKSPEAIQYAQPGRIVGTGLAGDVVVLAPEAFMDVAAALEAVYAARGLTVALASYREVYDEFNQGVESPGAVRSFVRHALDHWAQPPRALLLVGDSNHDPLGHVTGLPPVAPLFRIVGNSTTRFGAGDDGFVMVHDGATLPEIPVSRIPASTRVELQAYIDKLISHGTASSGGSWANRVIVAADDEWNGSQVWEAVSTTLAENLVDSLIPFSMEVEKLYLINYPWPPGTSPDGVHPEKPEARADFVEALNRGSSSVIYFGHGSYNQIAQENLLSTLDVPGLSNQSRLPVAFFASCNTGQFDMLGAECFSEALVRHSQGGAVAAIGSTHGSYSSQNELLLNTFVSAMYGPLRASAGEALWLAKVAAYNLNNYFYNILGDGGVTAPMADDRQTSLRIPASGLLRGRLNSVEVEFPTGRTMEVAITESGRNVLYVSPFYPYVEIPWIRHGKAAYRGMVETGPDGRATVDFFMPVQADTGSLARAHALGNSGAFQHVAWEQWCSVADSGGYSADSTGPVISMSCRKAGLSHVLTAELEDESGISLFGSEAGRAILLSINTMGFDVSSFFQYFPGSHTRGVLNYTLPELSAGEYTLILAAWDGMGNGSLDTLSLTVSAVSGLLLSRVSVFPNPGAGVRAFVFETSEPGSVSAMVFTVTGRPVWEGALSHGGGAGQLVWEGRDADGDLPAAGAYIYQVTLETADGRSSSVRGILAVSPEGAR